MPTAEIDDHGQDSSSNQPATAGLSSPPPQEAASTPSVSPPLDAVALEEMIATSLDQMQQMLTTFGHIMKQRSLQHAAEIDIEDSAATVPMSRAPSSIHGRLEPAPAPRNLEAVFDKIMSQVKPWDMSDFDLLPCHDPDPSHFVRQFTSNLDKQNSAQDDAATKFEFAFIENFTRSMSARLKNIQVSIEEAFGIMACCCLAVYDRDTRIGNVLRLCYMTGVRIQPTSMSKQEYIKQILIVVICSHCMNRIFCSISFRWSFTSLSYSLGFRNHSLEEILGIDLFVLLNMVYDLKLSLRDKNASEEKAIGSTLDLHDLSPDRNSSVIL